MATCESQLHVEIRARDKTKPLRLAPGKAALPLQALIGERI